MPVLFDQDTHRLRLDRETFQSLVTWWSGPRRGHGAGGDPTRLAALRSAGVLGPDDRVHSALDPGLDAVANPICRLVIQLRTDEGRSERGDAWVGGELTALLLDLPGELSEFGVLHPTFLPAMLARVVELGPRPRLSAEPVQATPELLDQLTDPDRREAASRPLAHQSLAQVSRDWRIQASWNPGPGGTGVRVVRVLDTPEGLWLVEPYQGRAVLFPTTPTAVWYALVRLLPTDQELPQ